MRRRNLTPFYLHRAGRPTSALESRPPRRRLRSVRVRMTRAPQLPWRVTMQPSSWSEVQELGLSNLRRGGLFVCSQSPPPTGAAIVITISLPDGDALSVTGTVVRSIGAAQADERAKLPGFGLQFDSKHEMELTLLEVKARAESVHEAAVEEFAVAAELSSGGEVQRARVLPLSENKVPTVEIEPLAVATDPIFGIDIGSSFSRIALVTQRGVRVLKDEAGRAQQPSTVAYLGSIPLAGWEADSLAADGHHCVIENPKRLLGRRTDDVRLQHYLQAASFSVESGANEEILVRNGGERLSMVDVLAAILLTLKNIGKQATGTSPRRVMLSVPHGFSDRQRAMVRAAAHVAGLEVVGLIDEAVAAATTHGLGKAEGALLAVYDFGGGGFNCSVLEVRGQKCRVISTGGDPWAGGDAFDRLLAKYAAPFYAGPKGRSVRRSADLWSQLLQRCERLKWRLSTSREAVLSPLTFEGEALGPPLKITRALMGELCGKVVRHTMQIMDGCLREAGVEVGELDSLVLVGGMSRSPVVRRLLERRYGGVVELSQLPGEAVVVGNALHARMIQLSRAASMPLKFGRLAYSAA